MGENTDNIFESDIEAINEAIKEIDELYLETKSHFDMVKNSGHQRSLSFIHLQTGNLISLKNAKVSMLKERASLKKIDMELKIKSKNPEGNADSETIKELYKMIVNSNDIQTTNNYYEEDDYDDEDIDKMLEIRIREKSPELEVKKSNSYNIAVRVRDKRWSFVAIDIDGNIVENVELPNKKDYKIKLKKIDGERVAVDQNEKVYQVI